MGCDTCVVKSSQSEGLRSDPKRNERMYESLPLPPKEMRECVKVSPLPKKWKEMRECMKASPSSPPPKKWENVCKPLPPLKKN